MRRPLLLGAALACALLALPACEPCAGTAQCSTAPRVSAGGRTVVYAEGGRPIGGVALEFVRTAGDELVDERLTATSDADGWFRFAGAVRSDSNGAVVGDLTVRPPSPRTAYTVPGVRLATSTVRGEGAELGRVVVDPYVAVVGEVRSLATSGVVPGARVRFRRTGGLAFGPGGEIEWNTDAGGRFFLEGQPATFGTVQGELTVESSSLPKAYTVPFAFTTEWRDHVPEAVRLVRLGNAFVYVGDVYRRGTFKGIPNVEVEFVRTGGVETEPSRVVVRTNADGRFPIVLAPAAAGEVVGDLHVRPPAPFAPFSITGMRMPTFETDSIGLVGRWGIGAQVFGALELVSRATGRLLPGGLVAVFRRTGGVRIDPDTQVVETSPYGAIPIRAAALEPGEVIGNVEVRLPPPFKPDTVRGVRLQSREDDRQVYLGAGRVGAWIGYTGRVVTAAGAPVAGARIEFRRTGGIDVVQPYATTSNADGYFPLTVVPNAEGEVVGDVVITPPSPLRAATITGVHLSTFATETLRFAGNFVLP